MMITSGLIRKFNSIITSNQSFDDRYPTLMNISHDDRLYSVMKRYDVDGYLYRYNIIGRFVFMPRNAYSTNRQYETVSIYVLSESRYTVDPLEVYGVLYKKQPDLPYMYKWYHRFLYSGWKHKGPWMKDIEKTMRDTVKAYAKYRKERSLEIKKDEKLEKLKLKNKINKKHEDFIKEYK